MKLLAVLIALALPMAAQVKITAGADKIAIRIDGELFTEFHIAGADLTKPYLWPLRAASGTYVTRMWPMADVPEEAGTTKDHRHQRGLWFAHEGVNGFDFWNNEASYTTPNRGRIVFRKLGTIRGGKDSGSLAATFEWVDPDGGALLREDRTMTFQAGDARVIDFDITLTALRDVTFNDKKDGLFGIRLRPALQEDTGTGHITDANGGVGEKQVWGKVAAWSDYSGVVGGEALGVAIFPHPDNPRPSRWHVRAYGLFAANPFGLAAFTGDKSQDGSMRVPKGGRVRFRYRVIVHPGDAQTAGIPGLFRKYVGEVK